MIDEAGKLDVGETEALIAKTEFPKRRENNSGKSSGLATSEADGPQRRLGSHA